MISDPLRTELTERFTKLKDERVSMKKRNKPKRAYLNKDDKHKICTVAGMASTLDIFIAEWEELRYPRYLIANAKRSRTFLYGILNQFFLDIPITDREPIIRMAGRYRFEAHDTALKRNGG